MTGAPYMACPSNSSTTPGGMRASLRFSTLNAATQGRARRSVPCLSWRHLCGGVGRGDSSGPRGSVTGGGYGEPTAVTAGGCVAEVREAQVQYE
jgi:hypothetical protein